MTFNDSNLSVCKLPTSIVLYSNHGTDRHNSTSAVETPTVYTSSNTYCDPEPKHAGVFTLWLVCACKHTDAYTLCKQRSNSSFQDAQVFLMHC